MKERKEQLLPLRDYVLLKVHGIKKQQTITLLDKEKGEDYYNVTYTVLDIGPDVVQVDIDNEVILKQYNQKEAIITLKKTENEFISECLVKEDEIVGILKKIK